MNSPNTAVRPRKVVIPRAGAYDRLTLEAITPTPPAADEIQIAVEAAGINYADTIVRRGLYKSAKEYVGWPITPGFEVAGRVVAVGSDVTTYAVGDQVAAVTRFGGYTTHLNVDAKLAFRYPDSLTAAQAAALPAVMMTAWYALYELAHPRPGHTLLVHSAAGGVGGSLVQLGKIMGCRVVGVVGRTHKVEVAKDLGADAVIDKSTEDLWARAEALAPDGYDVILDANGVATLADSYAHLKRPGKLVVYGFSSMMPKGGRTNWFKLISGVLRTPKFNPLQMTTNSHSVLAFNLSYLFDQSDLLIAAMGDIFEWLQAGQIKAPPVQSFRLDDVAEAHRAIESGNTVGKLVLVP